jgi:exopolyphosphatase/guanosine-5'-triphosphate,3'-diphosphate pyrophosphatase
MLFDQLSGTFQPRERILVQVAAILHDIGMFISAKGHHRHSAELVAASDILGLSRKELQEIAWTVRFHRKGLPGGTAVEYRAMDRPARLSIFRMAAIIRLADALSEPGLPRVERLVLDFSETVCTMQVELAGRQYEYLEIMRILLENKKSYFENYYGTDLALERFRLVEGV